MVRDYTKVDRRKVKGKVAKLILYIITAGINSHSIRLFWSGVPVKIILLLDRIEFIAFETADASFFRIWPSSQTTKSGPIKMYRKTTLN